MNPAFFTIIFSFFCSGLILAQDIDTDTQITDSVTTTTVSKPDIEDATIEMMIDGLTSTPLYENSDRMANLTRMFMQWAMDTDKVRIEILPYFADITETNKILSVPFLCGWVQYSLNNGWIKNDLPINENMSAVEAVIKYYRANEDKLLNDKYILDLEEKIKNNELEPFIKAKIEESKAIETATETLSSLAEGDNPANNILVLVDGKETSLKKMKEISPHEVENITILKEEKDVKKHTKKKVDGIIIITLKKQ